MSAEGNTMNENEKAVAELSERFEKKGKVVALSSDDQDVFTDFASGIQSLTDWTEGVDANVFTGLAVVKADNQRIALIPIASEEAVFADPIVRKALYRLYVNKVVNAAGEDDAVASQFLTVAGNFKQKFDLDAFKFQAKVLTKFLRGQGLSGITNNALRMSFQSAAFAKTQFPRVDAEAWDKIIGIAEAQAQKNGYDTSIFDHWKATRSVTAADTSVLKLDFDELMKEEDALSDDEENKS
jgi:hypothetical protein